MTNALGRCIIFLVTISLCLNRDGLSNGLRILGVFPYNMNSMNVICEELMKGLAAKGHRVDVYSHYPPKKSPANFTHFNLAGSLAEITSNVSFSEVEIPFIPSFIKTWVQIYGPPLCNLLEHPHLQKLIREPPRDPPYDLVIIELSIALCYLALGRHLDVPMVTIVNAAMPDWNFEPFGSPVNPAVDPSVYLPYSPPMTFLERLHNVLMTSATTYTFNRYVREQNKYVEKFFGPNYPDVVELQRDSSLVLLNYDPTLSGVRTFAPIVVPISGMHVVDRNESLPLVVQRWLDDASSSSHGCIYVSFGSMTRIETLPRYVLDVFYESFRNIAPTRVLMKIAKPEVLPPDLPGNVLTQPWFSQIQVLKHRNVKAFVTHGGLMGTTESIYFGVPMIGMPIFFDQSSNIENYVRNKMAIRIDLDTITEKSFTRALKEMIINPEYRNAVIKARDKSRDRPMSPMDSAAFWIEYVHRHGKDALKSPVASISWWQASLLDVYAFITIFIFMILFILGKIIRKTIDFTFRSSHHDVKQSKVKRN